MISKIIVFIFSITTLGFSNSCYEFAKIDDDNKNINTAFFVLVDQTTLFNKNIQEQILKNSLSQTSEGNLIYIAKFSAFVNGYYNEKVFDFIMDYSLNEEKRDYINKSKLKRFDKCLKEQKNYVSFKIIDTITKSFLHEDEDIPKSDILFAFQSFSNVISESNAKKKIILIASDMLENSIITSFYNKGKIKKIDYKTELKKVEKEGLFANFGGADIYVIGAGITNEDPSSSHYKDPRKLMALKHFWTEYINRSNGKLIEFGQPTLNKMIKRSKL